MKRLADLGMLGQDGGESEEVVLEMSKSVFDKRLKHGGCSSAMIVLDSSLRRIVDEIATTRLQCSI